MAAQVRMLEGLLGAMDEAERATALRSMLQRASLTIKLGLDESLLSAVGGKKMLSAKDQTALLLCVGKHAAR